MNDLVVKSNRLNSAIQNLSKAEIRMVQLAIVDARETGLGLSVDKPLTLSAERFASFFKTTKENAYARLKEAEETLFNRRFSFTDSTGNLVKSRWISQVTYLNGEGAMEVYFTPAVVHEITRLDGKEKEQAFTKYFVENTKNFGSGYSIRLYELLTQWKTAKTTPVFELEQFRGQLGLGVNDYKLMSDFKKRVLDKAVKEINDKSDLKVSYEQEKRGRTITGFKFAVKAKEKPKDKAEDRDKNTVDWINGVTDNELKITRPLTKKQANGFAGLITKYCDKDGKGSPEELKLGNTLPPTFANWYSAIDFVKSELQDEKAYKKYIPILSKIGYKEVG